MPVLVSRRYASCDEIHEADLAQVADFAQCGRGSLSCEVVRVEFPQFFIDVRHVSNDTIVQVMPHPNFVWFTVPVAAGSAYVYNGLPLERPAVLFNARPDLWVRRARSPMCVTVGIERGLVEPVLATRLCERDLAALMISAAAFTDDVDRPVALARDLAHALAHRSAMLCIAAAEPRLRRLLLERFVGLLGRGLRDGTPERCRERARRVAIAASRVVDERLEARLGTAELAGVLEVSARTLQNAFATVYGMSPSRYLKLRRLHHARRALRQPEARRAPVKRAALAAGFTELGRFAGEYRALFDESPSETALRAAGSAMPENATTSRRRPGEADVEAGGPRPAAPTRTTGAALIAWR